MGTKIKINLLRHALEVLLCVARDFTFCCIAPFFVDPPDYPLPGSPSAPGTGHV